ncbi:hypothetical protein T439DRAFT_325303 [Meredithblackwellia eburnea MCA 4105]
MKTSLFVSGLLSLSALVNGASTGKDVDVTIKFPDTNPFARVQNGHSSNLLQVRFANHAGEELVITSVHGQYRESGGKQRALRNTTNLPLRQSVLPGLASPLIPYKFHSENKVGEVGLRVWVDYLDAGKKQHSVLGFDGTVNVVEPPTSWLDPHLLFAYLVLGAGLYFAGTWVYGTYISPPASTTGKSKAKRAPRPSTPQTPATPTGEGKYEEDWIPAHHLRSRKEKIAGEGATSGEESEGGTPRRRSGRGKK